MPKCGPWRFRSRRATGQLTTCEQLLALPQCPTVLSIATDAALIRAYLHVKDFDKATQLFKCMRDQGVVANQAIYTSFLFAYSFDQMTSPTRCNVSGGPCSKLCLPI